MFKEIESLYAEPHRRYHTARHIEACLGLFDLAAPRMEQPDEVEIALWFHDVIYELCAADNERRSADLFIERAGDGVDETFRRRVEALIMVTVTHENPQGVDQAYMIDIDLSSFGQSWEGFLRDSKAVREELPHVADDDFKAKHRPFLEKLLARDPLYKTPFMQELRGEQAQRNIRRYLDEYLPLES